MPRPIKIVLFGEARTGKTQLWRRLTDMSNYTRLSFNPAYQASIGADFVTKRYEETMLHIWDTVGDPKYVEFMRHFFQKADVGFYCISLTDELNPQKISNDLACFRQEAGAHVSIFLIGTKIDVKEQERKISDDQFNSLLNNEHYNFQGGLKISSKTDAGLEDLLKLIPKNLLEERKLEQPSFATNAQGFYKPAEKRTENTNDTICGMPSWLFWTCLGIPVLGWVVGLLIVIGISIYNCCTSTEVVENEKVATYPI